ncbi:restriction endonuclease subunit S [Agrococcus beijingensis]|uniref:restriction endonuclease subunit S n=1 Tax=Agrococcus beijingensis TaxID=3068634 RepID=UPI0027419399|nr:restriction endonuclease subunit S [Agrococcus sp. REN33]
MRLGEAIEVRHGYAFPGTGFGEDPHADQVLTPGNFGTDGAFRDGKPKSFAGDYPAEFLLENGEVVVTMTDLSKNADTLGFAVRLPRHRRFLHNQRIGLLVERIPGVIDLRYLTYLTRTASYRRYIIGTASGSTVRHTSPKRIEAYAVQLPPLPEQQGIAEVLGALDEKIVANAKLVATCDRLAEVKTMAAVDPSTRVPLTELAAITMGSSPRGEFLNEEGTGTVFYQGVRDFGIRTPTPRVWTESVTRWAQAGDTLLSVRAPVGRVNVADGAVCIGRGLASVRSATSAPWTLFNLLKAHPELWVPFDAEGTIFSSINRAALEELAVSTVPSASAAGLEDELTAIELLIAAHDRESNRLAALRDALLPELMSGRLRVKDAERAVEEVL